jgi:hypothetical protein
MDTSNFEFIFFKIIKNGEISIPKIGSHKNRRIGCRKHSHKISKGVIYV